MRGLTVAHVLSSFGVGGQERVALDLAVGQRAAGCEVHAVSIAPPPEGPLSADFTAAEIAVHTVEKRGGFDLTLPARLALFFRRARVDVVHTHNPLALIYGAPAARIARARAIHTKHGANPDRGRQLHLRRAAGWMTHGFVAVSEATEAIARALHEAPAARITTIPNGIDLARFHPDPIARREVRAELSIPESAWVIGTVGRLSPEKDQALLLRSLAPMLGENHRAILVGDGPERSALVALAESLKIARFVHFAGARRDVPRWLAAFDLFALTSRSEGLPLVIPEAMATSLPVVSTAVGGIPAVVQEGVTGSLAPAGSEADLARCFSSLTKDRARAAQLGATGRSRALERYSAERMVRDYFAIYARAGARH
jgi:glycosyltransferase involved in cell wall biosynthesis